MNVRLDRFDVAEIDDAIDACLQLHTVLQRLRRHRLLTPEEDHRTVSRVQRVCEDLEARIYEVKRETQA